jgi:dienelactone hydrolase
MIRALTVLVSAFQGGGVTCERTCIADVETLVARPKSGSGPVVVFANAATSRGIEQPAIGHFLGGLAQAGFVALAPELPHVREGEVTPLTVEALVAVARAAGPRVALVGASTGAGLAILAAGDPRLADRITVVMAIAPFASLEHVLRLATTGFYGDRPYPAAPLVATVTARSLAACAQEDPAVPQLLANRDPLRFDALYTKLEPRTRAVVRALSPVRRIGEVLAPIELVSSPTDRFFPAAESQALARSARNATLTLTHGLDHVRPRVRPGLVPVLCVLDRTLRRAAVAEPIPVLRPSLAA